MRGAAKIGHEKLLYFLTFMCIALKSTELDWKSANYSAIYGISFWSVRIGMCFLSMDRLFIVDVFAISGTGGVR